MADTRTRDVRSTDRAFPIRRLALLIALTLTWCVLWQEISVANVLAGLAVSAAVLATGVGTPTQGGIRLVPLIRLLWLILVDLVTSTVDVASEIVRRGDRPEEAIVAVQVPAEGRAHLLLFVVAVTLTPGTAVIDAEPDTGMLYLHLLRADRRDDVIAHIEQLSELSSQALPVGPATTEVTS